MTSLCSTETQLSAPAVVSPSSQPQAWQAVAALAVGSAAVVTAALMPTGALNQITGNVSGIPADGVATPAILAVISALTLSLSRTALDRGIVLATAAALLALAVVGAVLAPNPEVAQFSRMVGGVALGGFLAFGVDLASRLAPVTSARYAAGLLSAGLGAGVLLGISASAVIGGFVS